ncbi:MAG: thiamine pyrophosphate-binding protein [Caulobacterales bacterium]
MASEDQRLTGGTLLAQTLAAAGVKRVFALHGGHLDGFFKGCVEADIDLIDFRHEAAAGHAADAYARTTGELGVCAITAGPGFTNGVTAIANAYLDGSPVLFIIGSAPLREIESNPLQGGIDQIAIARPIAKWAISVPVTERIPDLAAMAIRKAMTGRKGPVVLEVPIDVLHASVSERQATKPSGLSTRPHPAPSPDEAQRMVALLRAARRPAIIAGMEAVSPRTGEALAAFVKAAGVPVFAKTQALGLLGAGHPLDGGAAGNLAILPMLGLERPDLVILLGARLGLFLGGRSGSVVPNDARLIQISADPGEAGRLRDVDLAIAADPAETLQAALVAAGGAAFGDYGDWPTRAAGAKTLLAGAYPERETAAGVHPFHAAAAVAQAVGTEAIWTLDGGEAASWGTGALSVSGPGRVLTHGYLGCLGTGLGFAIGAQVAHPERRVVHVTGDGSMGFHIQELDTIVRRGLPIVTVVLNNQVWGMCLHGQQIMYGQNYNVITKLGGTCYADVAGAFGCHAERVTRYDDIAPALERALASGKPAFVEIMTDADVVHPITVSMLGKVDDAAKEVQIPYYENVPAPAH